MNIYTIINIVSNCIMGTSAALFLISVFGDKENPIWKSPIKAWLIKLGLSITSCGAALNVLTMSTPAPTEVLLNCGLSLIFCWLSIQQREMINEKRAQAATTVVVVPVVAPVVPVVEASVTVTPKKRKPRAKKQKV